MYAAPTIPTNDITLNLNMHPIVKTIIRKSSVVGLNPAAISVENKLRMDPAGTTMPINFPKNDPSNAPTITTITNQTALFPMNPPDITELV